MFVLREKSDINIAKMFANLTVFRSLFYTLEKPLTEIVH